jgi:cytochrome c
MASSLEVNKMLAAILTAGIIASGTGVVSRMIYHPRAPEKNAYPIQVTEAAGGGAKAGAQKATPPLAVLLANGSAEHGKTLAKVCEACHNLGKGQPNKIGPHLYGVLGRDIASVSDFSYSDALKSKKGKWDYEKLNDFLSGPREWAPGTKMTFAGFKKPEDRADVILYLRTLSDNPEPLPAPPATAAAPSGQEQAGQQPAGQKAAEQKPAEQAAGQKPAEAQPGEQKQAAAEQAPKTVAGGAPAGGGEFAQLLAAADPAKGERDAAVCKACHNFAAGAGTKIGPDLHGVVGRDVASVEGFSYSSALKSKGGKWTYERLNEFLTSPKDFAPGTKMTFVGFKQPEKRAAVIAYLRSITDNPPPLPGKS